MVKQLPRRTVNGGLSVGTKYGKWLEMLVAQARQDRALQAIRRRRRMAGGLGKPADLHVFKSIEAILLAADRAIGRDALASTGRTASASQYGL
jgi:hypothetical protein